MVRPTFRASSSAASDGQPIAHDAADHPERADADRRGAVDEHRPVRRVVGDLEELVDLRVVRLGVDDRDVEVLQAGLLDGRLLLVGAMLAGLRRLSTAFTPSAFSFAKCSIRGWPPVQNSGLTCRKFRIGGSSG